MALASRATAIIDDVYDPEGFNLGLNQGRIAGAGFESLHMHVVPRAGDTNYMPVIADTRVMPQSLEQSYDALKGKWS